MVPAFYYIDQTSLPRHMRVRFVWLTLMAWLGLLRYDLRRALRFPRSYEHVRNVRVRRHSRVNASVAFVCRAVDEACVWYGRPVLCLQRSVVTTILLRRHAHNATLVIGFRPVPFESHAWVEVNDVVVNDRPQYKQRFKVLAQL
jgi:hypothetical protein